MDKILKSYEVIYKVEKHNAGKELRCEICDEKEIKLIR